MTEPTPSAAVEPAGKLPAGAPAPLLGASDIRRLAEEIGVRPTKTLGQNFVIDGNTIRRIVAAADISADEDGPGGRPGPRLADPGPAGRRRPRSSPSRSTRCSPARLPATVGRWRPEAGENFHLVLADAMKVDRAAGAADRAGRQPALQRRRPGRPAPAAALPEPAARPGHGPGRGRRPARGRPRAPRPTASPRSRRPGTAACARPA